MPIELLLFSEALAMYFSGHQSLYRQKKRLPFTPLCWLEAKAPVLASWSYQAMWYHKYTSNQLTKENAASLCAYIAFKSQIRLSDLRIRLASSGKCRASSPALRSHAKSVFSTLFTGERQRCRYLKCDSVFSSWTHKKRCLQAVCECFWDVCCCTNDK